MRYIILNDTTKALGFHMVSSADHVSPVTGANPTVLLSKNFSSFIPAIGIVSEVGYGWYKLTPNASDVDTLGFLMLRASAPGADNVDTEFQVVSYDQYNAINLGLLRLNSSISSIYPLVWDEQRSVHTIPGTFGADEWRGASSVVILPIYAYLPLQGIIETEKVWKMFTYDKIFASWLVDQDISGHVLYLIISDLVGKKILQINPPQITITQQGARWLVTVNAPNSTIQQAGEYNYFLRDNTVDLTILHGLLIVEQAPDIN